MKKDNLVWNISIKMMDPDDVSDNEIIQDIEKVDDLEQTDRDGRTLLINAAAYNRNFIVKYLLEHGSTVSARDRMGFSALHFAVQNANMDLIKTLLDAGADINQKNGFGNAPLMVANPVTHPEELYKLLLSYGADPNLKNDYGMTVKDLCGAYPHIMNIIFPEE